MMSLNPECLWIRQGMSQTVGCDVACCAEECHVLQVYCLKLLCLNSPLRSLGACVARASTDMGSSSARHLFGASRFLGLITSHRALAIPVPSIAGRVLTSQGIERKGPPDQRRPRGRALSQHSHANGFPGASRLAEAPLGSSQALSVRYPDGEFSARKLCGNHPRFTLRSRLC